MPQVPEYPKEDWMMRLGQDNGSRAQWGAKQLPPMDIIRMGGQAKGGGEDYSRWEKFPQSTNIEDRRGQTYTREPGELMANWASDQRYTYQHHYNNLLKGGVKQKDDSTSTFRAIGVDIGGKYYMLPTIWDGKQVSNKEAVKRAKEVGLDSFISDKRRDRAEKMYEDVHQKMMEDMTNPKSPIGMATQ